MEQETTQGGMDQFTRRYLIALLVIAAAALLWWLASWDSRVGELNSILENDSELAAYPYQFRVLSLENGVATVSSPRSAKVSVVQFLRIVHPELSDTSATSPAMMSAQDGLVKVQSRAGKLLVQQEEVETVRWTLDEAWFSSHGVYLDP